MTIKNPTSSKSEPTVEVENLKLCSALQKRQRYMGLIAIFLMAYIFLSPGNGFKVLGFGEASPRPFIMNESYHHKTVLSDLIIFFNQGDAQEVKAAGEYILGCEAAKRSLGFDLSDVSAAALLASMERLPLTERKKAAQLILNACAPPFLVGSENRERAQEAEPKYLDFIKKYQELLRQANLVQGLPMDGLQQPVPTSEMIQISEMLEEIQEPLVRASSERLILINNISHLVVLVLIVFGIWFREIIGCALFEMFGRVFFYARKLHEKI